MEQQTYDVDYFIQKFSEIQEHLWYTRHFVGPDNACCAFGHCGMTNNNRFSEAPEARELYMIAPRMHSINDGEDNRYSQPTPKQRVLAALYDIKRQQEPEFNEPPMTVDHLIGELTPTH